MSQDSTISALPSASALTGAEVIPIDQGSTKQTPLSVVKSFVATGPFDAGNINFSQSGSYSQGTVGLSLQKMVSVKDAPFNAKGDGSTDDTSALQAAFDTAKIDGRTVLIPFGAYNYTSLNLDGITQGLNIVGEGDPSGSTDFTKCSTLRCTSTGSGIGISVKSSYGVSLRNLALTYNSGSYTGDLVRTGHSVLGTDTAFLTIENCVFTGEGSAVGASSLFFTDQSIIERVHKCTFKNAVVGIKNGTSYTNVITIDDNTFQALTGHNVLIDGTTSCQTWAFRGNTFEALVNGKCSGIDLNSTTAFMEGLSVVGNWFGDVTVAGGLSWIKTKALGASIAGNYFATAGGGASDYAINITGCQGVSICGGNRFDDKAVNQSSSCSGVVICGNDITLGSTAIAVTGTQPIIFGNNGFTDTYGGNISIGGVAGPQVLFQPSSGATKQAQVQQSGNFLNFNDNGIANRFIIDLTTGQLQVCKALVSLGGGSAATLGTVGGSGPATAGQNTWMQFSDSTGANCWVPIWK